MARVPITEFGVIQKLLAGATVQVFLANESGENTGTLATLYQAATGSGIVSNPQTLDENGKLSVNCYVDGSVVAEISNISDLADRSLKKLRANPTQFPLGATNAAFEGSNVSGFVDDAEAAATQAGNYLGLIEDTFQGIPSTTNLSISSGSKTFTVASGLPFGAGQYIIATSNANPTTHNMNGQVTAYSGTSLTITVDAFLGSGSRADWTIRNSGPRGATGATGPAGAGSGDMLKSENLSGLANYATARSNLGLGTAAQSSASSFATAAQGAKADTAVQSSYLTTPPILRVQCTKLSGVNGGQRASAGSWQDSNLAGEVLLNTTVTNNIAGASHSAGTGVITLVAGTYKLRGWKQFFNTAGARVQFYNVTDGAPLVVGSSAYAGGSGGVDKSLYDDQFFTIAATKSIKMQTWVGGSSGGTGDLGIAASTGDTEIYGDFTFEKVS